MKDYTLIRYFAKGDKDSKIKKDNIITSFMYGDALVDINVCFEKRKSVGIMYLLGNVYELYAKNKFSSLVEFVKAFTTKHGFYKMGFIDENDVNTVYISCDLSFYKIDHAASQAFADINVFINALNDFLKLNEENVFDEDNVRDFHREYLKHQKNKMMLSVLGGICTFGLGFALLYLGNGSANGFLTFLAVIGILAMIAAPVPTIIFGVRAKFYKKELERSINNRR